MRRRVAPVDLGSSVRKQKALRQTRRGQARTLLSQSRIAYSSHSSVHSHSIPDRPVHQAVAAAAGVVFASDRLTTSTHVAPMAVRATNGSSESAKLPVASLITPMSEIIPPPTRLAVALIPARPAATVLADNHPEVNAQNGPLNE